MDPKIPYIYETLLAHYGEETGKATERASFSPQGGNEQAQSIATWWPANTPYEVMVGAVLTQNTAWSNVEKAIANFGGSLAPELIRDMDSETLAEIIRPAGFFKQKAGYVKNLTTWYEGYGFDVATVQTEVLEKIRGELLSVKGIGRETADSILLYAFGFATFVIDAYTMRLIGRYPVDAGSSYEAVKSYFEDSMPKDRKTYDIYHGLIVIHAKTHCRKKPLCDGCPLQKTCASHII